jgi:hypothetical protein
MSDNQAQADIQDPTPVTDPLDAVESTFSGTTKNTIDAYEALVRESLDAPDEDPIQGETPDEVTDELEELEQFSDENDDTPVEDDEDVPEVKAKDRFRFKDETDQKIAAVAKAMGVSLIEAVKIVEGQKSPATQQADPLPTEESESSASVREAIKELKGKKKEELSLLNFENATDIDDQIDELREKLDELKITEARENSRKEQAATDSFYAQYAASEDKTIGLYPDAAVKNSPMAKEMARIQAEMLELGDPLYYAADKPFILAKEAALNLGIPMRKPWTAPVKKSVQHRPIQPASGNARTTTNSAQRTSEVIAGIKTSDDYERLVASM